MYKIQILSKGGELIMCHCKCCDESEEENSFWGDVCFYMEENKCDKETAMKAVEPFYIKHGDVHK
ncbi:hypothetical protein [Paenibacillus sophorae]|uniref:Uncharacterized protein n=2 Tax=Paenibacillus sophorae TaxID=1333845 RepID=A0ABX8H8Z4_9BACL|nr:hypothetical protein [Paenibacillus sophorae]QWU14196.1 hypothetical protein KP014_19995 [Paenibacillus sophorae]